MPKYVGPDKQGADTPYMLTGFFDMDRSFNPNREPLGIPYGCWWELFGKEETGKSTVAYSLASMIAKHQKGGWILMDLENAATPEYLVKIGNAQGMDDDAVIEVVEGEDHETQMQRMLDAMNPKNDTGINVSVLDSLAHVASKQEMEGDIGSANMGKRAQINNQLSRRFIYYKRDMGLLNLDATNIVVNHQQPGIGPFSGS